MPRQPWMIWYAISLHILYGTLLLVDETNVSLAVIGGFQHITDPLGRVFGGFLLLVVAILAMFGIVTGKRKLLCLSAQYLVLLVAFFSSLEIIFGGYISTTNGLAVPTSTILFAVGPIALAAFWHTMAIFGMLRQEPDPYIEIRKLRSRIVDLELARRDIDPYHD